MFQKIKYIFNKYLNCCKGKYQEVRIEEATPKVDIIPKDNIKKPICYDYAASRYYN